MNAINIVVSLKSKSISPLIHLKIKMQRCLCLLIPKMLLTHHFLRVYGWEVTGNPGVTQRISAPNSQSILAHALSNIPDMANLKLLTKVVGGVAVTTRAAVKSS